MLESHSWTESHLLEKWTLLPLAYEDELVGRRFLVVIYELWMPPRVVDIWNSGDQFRFINNRSL